MNTIAVMSQKGGVGKTITVANLGPALAAQGLRVLMVDMDPQADLSASWGIEENEDFLRIEDLLAGQSDHTDAALVDMSPVGLADSLYLLPSSSDLRRQTARLLTGPSDHFAEVLTTIATPIDVALIDTPAGETIFGAQAIVAADQTIVTLLPGYHELRALTRVLDRIDRQSEAIGTDLSLLGVLIANADPRWRTTRDYADHLNTEQIPLFDTIIPRRQAVTGHARYGEPTILLEPGNAVAQAYARLAEEVTARLKAPTAASAR